MASSWVCASELSWTFPFPLEGACARSFASYRRFWFHDNSKQHVQLHCLLAWTRSSECLNQYKKCYDTSLSLGLCYLSCLGYTEKYDDKRNGWFSIVLLSLDMIIFHCINHEITDFGSETPFWSSVCDAVFWILCLDLGKEIDAIVRYILLPYFSVSQKSLGKLEFPTFQAKKPWNAGISSFPRISSEAGNPGCNSSRWIPFGTFPRLFRLGLRSLDLQITSTTTLEHNVHAKTVKNITLHELGHRFCFCHCHCLCQ